MTQSLEDKVFLTTLGLLVSVDLVDIPNFKGLMVKHGLAQIDNSGKFIPNAELKVLITDPHSTPIHVVIDSTGKQTCEYSSIYE